MDAPVVDTACGRLQGRRDGALVVFAGVPFAAPPVGERRFQPPQPPAPWAGTRPARAFGSAAPQNPSMIERFVGSRGGGTSEDCLSLNVWTPGCDDARRPVMVWIHGGAFLTGSGAAPWYDGASLAAAGDVVVITVNYRLGALGFLHLAELGGERFAGSANAGILDQVAALRWVHENVSAFGGDPGNVTVFGESAGAMSVGTLLGLPAAAGLFRRAVLQSGAAQNVLGPEAATRTARLVLAEAGVDPHRPAELLHLPVERLLAAQAAVVAHGGAATLPFQPVVDGATLPRPPADAVADGSVAGVSVLLGTTLDEMRLFTVLDATLADLDHDALVERCRPLFGDRAHDAVRTYVDNRPAAPPAQVWSAILTDQVFRQPAIRLAERQAAHQPDTWMYLFTWPSPAFGGALGACHAVEIPFVFDNLHQPGVELFTGDGEERAALATTTRDAWLAFARTGDPNHAGLPAWRRYDPAERSTMLLGLDPASADDPFGDERLLWAAAAGAAR
ncbi:MAG: carboxylesterase/lipase family protein [Acidimicrobiales bacterium]|nr:carboxylesterase/lipase family protein [Acidimicrobiales bacterium]